MNLDPAAVQVFFIRIVYVFQKKVILFVLSVKNHFCNDCRICCDKQLI